MTCSVPGNRFSCPPTAVSNLLSPTLFAFSSQILAISSLVCTLLFTGAFGNVLIGRDTPPKALFLLMGGSEKLPRF